MNVFNCLASVLTAVIYDAVAVCKSHLCRDLRNSLKNSCDLNAVIRSYLISTADVSLGHNETVHGRLRIYILERINIFIFINL